MRARGDEGRPRDRGRRRRAEWPRQWRRFITALAAITALLAAVDVIVGYHQQRLLDARRAYKARLDRMAFFGLRTGIDSITYQPESRYRIQFRLQNALDEPIYVMMPSVQGYVQVRAGWQPIPTEEAKNEAQEGTVVKLTDEHPAVWIATVDEADYMQLLRGYMHLKLILDAYVSPEDDPQEEVGERHEDLFLYLRDRRLPDDAAADGRSVLRPDYIPTRAWTLIPKPVR